MPHGSIGKFQQHTFSIKVPARAAPIHKLFKTGPHPTDPQRHANQLYKICQVKDHNGILCKMSYSPTTSVSALKKHIESSHKSHLYEKQLSVAGAENNPIEIDALYD